MVAGRQPAADDPNGVWVDRTFARSRHLKVGQTFTYTIITPDLLNQAMSQPSEQDAAAVLANAPASLRGHARIDGIGVTSDGVVVDPGYTPASFVLTPAFRAAHAGPAEPLLGGHGPAEAGYRRRRLHRPGPGPGARRIHRLPAGVGGHRRGRTTPPIPQVIALEAFAGLAALLGLVIVSQAISRRLQIDARHNSTLAAMGMTRPQRAAESMTKGPSWRWSSAPSWPWP